MRVYTTKECKQILGESNWRRAYAKLNRTPTLPELIDAYNLYEMDRQLVAGKRKTGVVSAIPPSALT